MEISGVDHAVRGERLEIYNARPIRLVDKDDGNRWHLVGLNQSEQFEQLIERPKTTRKSYQCIGPHREVQFADREIVKLKREIGRRIGIRLLFVRQPNVESYGMRAVVRCAAVGRFHAALAAAPGVAASTKPGPPPVAMTLSRIP